MLVYIFWHWPRPGVSSATYEADLGAFHRALAAAPPPRFRHSFTCAVAALPWPGGTVPGYEDWYLVEDFAALGALNDAAVAGARRSPHDRAASAAAGGAGGLYRVLHDALDLEAARVATWVGKPAGVDYPAFRADVARWTAEVPHALAQRQLVLGPAPEFCLLSREPLPLPSDAGALAVPRRLAARP